MMNCLQDNSLKIYLDKCFFGNTEVSYLGFSLTPQGIAPGKDKLAGIKQATPLTSVKMVCSFVGLCNSFRTDIKNLHLLAQPLNKLQCKNSTWKDSPLPQEALDAFCKLKSALTLEPIVVYPRSNRQYALIVHTSTGIATTSGGMGFILAQTDQHQNFHVISYGPCQLVNAVKNYSPFLLEMLAAVRGMKHYNNYLRGRKFVL